MIITFEPSGRVSSKYDFVIDMEDKIAKKEFKELFYLYEGGELTNRLIGDTFDIYYKYKGKEFNMDIMEGIIKKNTQDWFGHNEETSEKWAKIVIYMIDLVYQKYTKECIKEVGKKEHEKDFKLFYSLSSFINNFSFEDIFKSNKLRKEFNEKILEFFPFGIYFDIEESFEIGKYCYVSPRIYFYRNEKHKSIEKHYFDGCDYSKMMEICLLVEDFRTKKIEFEELINKIKTITNNFHNINLNEFVSSLNTLFYRTNIIPNRFKTEEIFMEEFNKIVPLKKGFKALS